MASRAWPPRICRWPRLCRSRPGTLVPHANHGLFARVMQAHWSSVSCAVCGMQPHGFDRFAELAGRCTDVDGDDSVAHALDQAMSTAMASASMASQKNRDMILPVRLSPGRTGTMTRMRGFMAAILAGNRDGRRTAARAV